MDSLLSDPRFPDGHTNIFHMLSGKIKVTVLPRKVQVVSDRIFQNDTPFTTEELKRIEYRSFINRPADHNWNSLSAYATDSSGEWPFGQLLADTLIKAAEQLVLQFRFKGSEKIIQENIFNRPAITPVILGYRLKDGVDTVDNYIKSQAIKSKGIWMGYDSLETRDIAIQPGKNIDILFKKLSLNQDSCILYRFKNENGTANIPWSVTGHFLSLTDIASDNTYVLELKYVGMNKTITYFISVLPYWYQQWWIRILFVSVALLTVLIFPYRLYKYKLRKEREKRMAIQAQLRTVQHQLNPHFVYNALGSIQGLVSANENQSANEYLSSFSEMLRRTLKNSTELFVPLSQEINMLKDYLFLEQLRFGFEYLVRVDDDLDINNIEFPPMLLQPSVGNAVKHGVARLKSAGLITLIFFKKNKDFGVLIKDNGTKPDMVHQANGYGIKFTEERIESLKKICKPAEITYSIVYTSSGTEASFIFKNWLV